MQWRVLGSVEAWNGDAWMPVPAGKQRDLLAIMLMHPGQMLERRWLVETLWEGRGPESAVRLLPHYVWRLRGLLPGCAERLRGVPSGYLLEVAAGDLDSERFGELLAQGRHAARSGEPDRVVRTLSGALGLWRGPALADARTLPVLDEAARRLDQQRTEAREVFAEALLDIGRSAEAVTELVELTAAEPFRELPWRLLMLALHGSGRRPDALDAFQRLRALWTDELGIEPSQELHDLHRRLLADDPTLTVPAAGRAELNGRRLGTAPGVPKQVPATGEHFIGRAAELAELTRLAEAAAEMGGAVVISAIAGTAGIGKTALAVHFAHRIADRFPDGQLYVNLRGFAPGNLPTDPGVAIRSFLDALGVPLQRIPADLDAQAALYRTVLAGRRMLVLLDNAGDADQVRSLLPGAPGCLVVVTSRSSLAGLVATEGARPLILDLLAPAEAGELLARRLGRDRVAAEPNAVDEIITLCARLPLALAITAARAATRPDLPLADIAKELREGQGSLDAFDTGDALADVRTVFSWSYRRLSSAAARVFRLLGLHPGPDIGVPAIASLAGLPPRSTQSLLDELARAHLILEHLDGRYVLHDLLRAFAAEMADRTDAEPDRQAASRRMLDHYLHTAHTATMLLDPHQSPAAPAAAQPGTTPERLADYHQALAWFTVEHWVLVAAVDHAGRTGFDAYTWQLAGAMRSFFDRRGHWQDWADTHRAALDAARRMADRPAQAYACRGIGGAYTRLTQYDHAATYLRLALDIYLDIGDVTSAARTHLSLAIVLERQGRYADELDQAKHALDRYRAVGDRVGEANALNAVGWSYALLGQCDQALDFCQQAVARHKELGDRHGQAAAWDSLGYAHHRNGDHDRAIACFQHVVEIDRELGDLFGEADTLGRLGDAHDAAGSPEAARAAWQQAVEILDGLGHPDADRIRAKLDAKAAGP
ncbi:AfsR/SARP family transcriptional regulator [Rhizocola hellebori]|nr:AfsR/SARP family transcriptional regulator [Rhizocola hellebori]